MFFFINNTFYVERSITIGGMEMTFASGKMRYLCYIYLINKQGLPWIKSLSDKLEWNTDRTDDRHKERLIAWAYKKKLFNTKDLTRGIKLTLKGMRYVEDKATERDWNGGRSLVNQGIEKGNE